ncbi:MAG: methyltransferase domain-containing protein [Sphingobacteriaceae bacterium]|nr:MAG: methyltransferase domain-containing protein [Sphingobacteriaceae bacterium]
MSEPDKQLFRFKQFAVDQTGCAMKINTDGVLLGSFAAVDNLKTILDIGTGTGVIALMLAQSYPDAQIDAVEIDEAAATTAGSNFSGSPFADRLAIYATTFQEYFENHPDKKYDLIVSNPPFYIDSLISPAARKNLAKHTDINFFNNLIINSLSHLTEQGTLWLILPINTAEMVKAIAMQNQLHLQKNITLQSFEHDQPHREVIALGLQQKPLAKERFVIYDAPQIYSQQYRRALANFFIAF